MFYKLGLVIHLQLLLLLERIVKFRECFFLSDMKKWRQLHHEIEIQVRNLNDTKLKPEN